MATVTGTNGTDIVITGSANDVINTGAGADIIYSGAGNDTINAGSGSDLVFAGSGNDTIIHNVTENIDINHLNIDVYDGGSGTDKLILIVTAQQALDLQTAITAFNASNHSYLFNFHNYVSYMNLIVINVESIQLQIVGPTNHAPVAVNDSATINEDAALVIPATMLTANDTDSDGDTLTVTSVQGAINGTVSLAAGVVTFTPTLNYNGPASFTYTISDGHGGTSTATMNIGINPVNDAPTLSANTITPSVAENTAGAILATLAVADPDAGDTHTYTVSDDRFEVVGDQLKLKAGVSLDYETTPGHAVAVDVTAMDATNASSNTLHFIIGVTDVNEAPTALVLSNQVTSVNENNSAIKVADIAVTDDALGSNVLSITGADASSFFLQGNELWFNAGADFEAKNSYDISVTVADASLGSSLSTPFHLSISDVNEAPTAANDVATVSEDGPALLIDVLANDTDPDAGDTKTLVSVNSATPDVSVVISGNQVSYDPGSHFNYLAVGQTATDTFTYTMKDSGDLTSSATVTMTITGVNDAPILAQGMTNPVVPEDTAVNFSLPAGMFTDVDGDTLTLTATLDDGSALPSWLAFDGSTFMGQPPQDFNGIIAIKVMASDGHGGSAEDIFNLRITPVNDDPVLAQAMADQHSDEDAAVNISLPAGMFTDVDGDILTLTASLDDGSALPSWLAFDGSTFTGQPPQDFNGILEIKVMADDGHGGSASDTFNLVIDLVNDAPVVDQGISNQAFNEDAPLSFAIPANAFADVDLGDTLTYSAVLLIPDSGTSTGHGSGGGGGSEAPLPSWLSFDGSTFSGTPDDPNIGDYLIKVTATDTGGLSASTSFTLTINNVNEAPSLSADTLTPSVDENVAGAILANLTVFDPDRDDTHTYTVSDNRFEILDGQLKLKDGISLNHESESSVSVDVTAHDAGNLDSNTLTFMIGVNDVNEAPTLAADTLTPSVDENAAGAILANITLIDPDVGDTHTYTLSDNRFEVLNGQLKLKDGISLNYETTPSVSVDVMAHDAGNLDSNTLTFMIGVNNVNDAPVAPNYTRTVNEDASISGQVIATDEDGPFPLAYSLINPAPTGLTFNSDGTWTFNAGSYDFLNANQGFGLNIFYTATDGSGLASNTGKLQIVIMGTNDPAAISGDTTGTVTEDGGVNNNILGVSFASGDLNIIDPDQGQAFFIPGNLNGTYGNFTFDNSTGAWTYTLNNNDPDTQALAQGAIVHDTLFVRSADNTDSRTIDITINGANDDPTGSATANLADGTEDINYTILASSLLQGFSDVDTGDILSVSNLTATHGSIIDNGNGTFTFNPDPNYYGAVDLTYNVVDGHGGSIAATQSFGLIGVNDAPTGSPTAVLPNGTEDTNYTILASTLLQGFSDVEGDTLSVSNLTSNHGTITSNGSGSWTFTPASNYNGAVNLSYNVIDGHGGSIAATQTFSLTPVNDAPVVTSPTPDQAATQGVPITINAGLAFTDPDLGDVLTYAAVGSFPGLTFDTSTGVFSGTPTFFGQFTILVTATDAGGLSVTDDFLLRVNAPPTITETSPANGSIVTLGMAVPISFTASDFDGSIAKVDAYVDGVLIGTDPSSPYSFGYTPTTTGTHTITGVATDDSGATTTSNPVTITVNSSPFLFNHSVSDATTHLLPGTTPSDVVILNMPTLDVGQVGYMLNFSIDAGTPNHYHFTLNDLNNPSVGVFGDAQYTDLAIASNTSVQFDLDSSTNGIDQVYKVTLGTNGSEIINAPPTAGFIYGFNGSNNIMGSNFNDYIVGGNTGIDTINGGAGNDTIVSLLGNDTLTGGSGSDTFLYDLGTLVTGKSLDNDVITDYSTAGDVLAFHHVLDANGGGVSISDLVLFTDVVNDGSGHAQINFYGNAANGTHGGSAIGSIDLVTLNYNGPAGGANEITNYALNIQVFAT
jgi:VCBS repeat-containing protein